jgi:hypothetical protein
MATAAKFVQPIPIFFGLSRRYKMVAKYKNPLIWTKFGFQVDYDVAN